MTQYTPDPSAYTQPYQPNQNQEERKTALRRFNRLYIYLPLGFVVALALLVVILLLVGIFTPVFPGTAAYASALADITIILFVVPQICLMALGPALLIWLIVAGRQRRQEGRPRFDEGGKLQVWLWRLDAFGERVQRETAVFSHKAANPIITFNGWLAYAKAFFQKIQTYLKRS